MKLRKVLMIILALPFVYGCSNTDSSNTKASVLQPNEVSLNIYNKDITEYEVIKKTEVCTYAKANISEYLNMKIGSVRSYEKHRITVKENVVDWNIKYKDRTENHETEKKSQSYLKSEPLRYHQNHLHLKRL